MYLRCGKCVSAFEVCEVCVCVCVAYVCCTCDEGGICAVCAVYLWCAVLYTQLLCLVYLWCALSVGRLWGVCVCGMCTV